MKNKIDRTQTGTKMLSTRLSTRTVAMVLCCVMLLTAIGSGSVLNAFALNMAADTADDAAAVETIDVEETDEASLADVYDTEETMLSLAKKDSDLAGTGYSGNASLLTKANNYTDNSSGYTAVINSSNVATFTVDLSGETIEGNYWYFKIKAGNDIFCNGETVGTSGANLAKNSNSGANAAKIDVVGNNLTGKTLTITVDVSGSVAKVSWVSSGSSSCSTDQTYTLVGTANIAGTAWAKDLAANDLTYSSSLGSYTSKTYNNIAAGTMDFRIIKDHTWSTTWGYSRANKIDSANIVTSFIAKPGSDGDNNIRMVTSAAANVVVYFDDSKTDTSAITVVVTPAASTVTAGTPTGGTITVNGSSSASNIAYNGTVSLVATPAANYHFGSWTANANLSFASTSSASTTATVTGDATATATFVKDSFNVSRNMTGNFTITTPSANTTKQWGTSVSVTAKAASGYYVDYLYYLVNNTGSEVKITSGAANSGTTETLSGSFSMPANNVTLYAHVHERTSNTITYGITSDSPSGSGYVSVGKAHNTSSTAYSKTQIDYTIDSGSKVIEGTYVDFGARAAAHYKFLGWYPNADGSGSQISSLKDYQKQTPSGGYYAKFAAETPATTDPRDPEAGYVKVFFQKTMADGAPYNYASVWNRGTGYSQEWLAITRTTANTYTMNSVSCYMLKIPCASGETNVTMRLASVNEWNKTGAYYSNESYNVSSMSEGSCYYITYETNDGYWHPKWVAASYTSTTAPADGETTTYYPAKLYVTNSDLGYVNSSTKVSGTFLSNYFCARSSSVTVNARPTDTANMKSSIRKVSGTSDTTSVIKYSTTTTSMTMNASATSATATVTFVEKDYYKVTFSAGTGGSVTATAGGTAITSGTMVQEGKEVVFTESPASGYSFNGWTGSGTGSGTTRTISSLSGAADVKAYFKKDKGTSNTGTYFGWETNSTGDNIIPSSWTHFSSTYVRDGHVWAYIDNVTGGNYYFISMYDSEVSSSSSDQDKCQKQSYRTAAGTAGSVWASTEFSSYITLNGGENDGPRFSWGTSGQPLWEGRCNYIRVKTSTAVEALIIDLGPDDGNGNAQTSKGDANHSFKENCYRIIPVFNTDASKVSIYAKDASFRDNTDYDLLPGIANTVISGSISNRVEHSEFETAVASKGANITVTTKIDAANKGNYYVRGFSFNGVTPALLEPNTSTGEYSQTYTIPADFDYDYLEITPIYYEVHKDGGEYVSFYIENYDKALEATGWGNTLSVYPYYQDNSGNYAATKSNAFGGYPGQPVIYNGGRRFIEIPTKYTLNSNAYYIKGLTMSNDYFDIVHRDYCREVDDHFQTYDYDDFYKIARETSDGNEVNGRTTVADQITFAFKYRTTTNNFSDNSSTVTYSNTGKSVSAPYSSFTNAEKTSKFVNGWEPLLDYHNRPIDIFGKQLTTAQQALDPILVVSDDYAINYVGRYATTWTVYRKNDAGTGYTKVDEIAPSALIVTSTARLADGSPYPAVEDEDGKPSQKKLSSYTSAYDAIKAYAGRPVEITYESAIRNDSNYAKYWSMTNASSEVSKRNDGRWFYSYMNEAINANLRIDYSDDNGVTYNSDTFKEGTNKGIVTGASVQFTNTSSDSEGPYQLAGLHDTEDYEDTVYSNFNHYYKFAATAGSGYVFAGWWFERDGIVTNVNEDLTQLNGKSQMTSNATFVARYIKNPSGNLTINHTVADGSAGDATTYVGVKAIKGSTETWLTGTGIEADHFTEDTFTISDPTYTTYKSGYTFQVWLKTVPNNSFTNFDRFSAKTAGEGETDKSADYFSTEHQETSAGATTTYFEVPADDLYALNANSFPVQQFDTLTYYSHLSSKSYSYNFNFTYPAYLSKYGTQGYRVTGAFTYDELNEFMSLSGDTLQFKSGDAKTTFLNKIAPYEDNFMQEISWDTSVDTSFSSDTISATVPAVYDDTRPINVTFKFSYAVDDYTNSDTSYLGDNEYMTVNVPDNDRPNHLTTFMPNGSYVTAPQTLMDGSTEMIFRYWSVTTVPDSKHSAVEYTRCYDNEFNFVLFQDAVITTVYTAKDTSEGAVDEYNPIEQQIADATNNGVTISFIENSRNQYNDNQSGNGMTDSRKAMGDRMYTDFLLNFNSVATDENGATVLKELPANTKKAGLIIEVAGTVDMIDGKYVTKTEAEYREMYGTTITEIGNKLSGKDTTVNQKERLEDYITGATNENPIRGAKSEFDVTKLDNKNRLQYSYSLLNRSHSNLSVGNNRYNVYRAYAYIGDVSGNTLTNIKISDKPVYFTIYDMASIQNYAEANATGGVQ